MRILIADDDEIQRDLLSTMLESEGYGVVSVCDGTSAWQQLQTGNFKIVFIDWMMPGLSGLELIRKIRSAEFEHYVYIILCTSRSSRADLVEGMRSGADDFLSKPVHQDELMVRVSSGERIIAFEKRMGDDNRKLAEAHSSLQKAYATIRADILAAAELQRNLLPAPSRLKNVSFESLFCPAQLVAGDIYNFFPLDEQHIGFYLLDVSGHGIPSAMLSVGLSKMLTTTPIQSSLLKRPLPTAPFHMVVSPEIAIEELNRRCQGNGDMYFTIVYGILDVRTGLLSITQAGHPHPVYLPTSGEVVMLGDGGFPVGILEDVHYDCVSQQMQVGDRLLLLSDGLLEARSASGEQFGMDRLIRVLKETRHTPLKSSLKTLEDTLREWVGAEFDDDVSLLALELGEPLAGHGVKKADDDKRNPTGGQ
jgi:sigma-B regulation protein RsbU (phosphoserine phosphatase)